MRFYTHVAVDRHGEVLLREVVDGKRRAWRGQFSPTLFLRGGDGRCGYSTIYGEPLDPVGFATIGDARRAIKQGFVSHGIERFAYDFIRHEYPGQVEYDIDRVEVVILDIEVSSDGGFPNPHVADKPVTAISLKTRDTMYTFGLYPHSSAEPDVVYRMCRNENEMLARFLDLWEGVSPDVVTGWNIDDFDMPFLVNRITRLLGETQAKRLSPWKRMCKITRAKKDGRHVEVHFPEGVSSLDYMRLFMNKNLVPAPYESYSLNAICVAELDEAKIDYSQYESLLDLYKRDYDTFIRYNQHDVRLVEKLERKRGLIALVIAMAYRAKVNYTDVLSASRPWDAMTFNYLIDRKIVPHLPREDQSSDRALLGGYVKPVRPGMYRWVASFDVASEYPNTIIGCNISPDTFLGKIDALDISWLKGDDLEEDLKKLARWHESLLSGALDSYRELAIKNDAIITANGCLYSRSKRGFVPELLSTFFDERQRFRKTALEAQKKWEADRDPEAQLVASRYETLQMAAKVALNSMYGCLSEPHFRWYDINLAESVTATGQFTIKWAERAINGYLNEVLGTKEDYVIAIDTDSLYVHFDPLVKRVFPNDADPKRVVDFIDAVCRDKIQPLLEAAFGEFARHLNVPENRIRMKREVIADCGVWTAAKNYILSIWDKEGIRYLEPKMEVKGIKAAKPSTPAACRKKIVQAFKLLVKRDRDSVARLVEEFRREFNELGFEDIASIRGISGLAKYANVDKSVPIQVRGALLYNALLEKHGIKTVPPIHDGDKARFCYMRVPNPTMSHVIAAPHGLPRQFGLDQYLDKRTQFEKTFLDPLNDIVRAVGWDLSAKSPLEDVFD